MKRQILLITLVLVSLIIRDKAYAQTAPIGGGYSNSAVLSDSGFVFWAGQTPASTTFKKVLKGEQTWSTTGYLEQIKAIYTGSGNHILAVDCDGNVFSWGNNGNGQLGNGAGGAGQFTTAPVRVLKGEQASSTAYLENVTYISTGNEASYALLSTGRVMAWGNGASGRLGNGSNTSSNTPVYVRTSNGPPITYLDNVVQLGGMENAAAALKADGTVWTWGSNAGDECGTNGGGSLAQQVPGLPPIVKITTGDFNVMALDANGQIWVWGTNSEGTLGDGLGAGGRQTPARVLAVGAVAGSTNYLAGVRDMAAGQFVQMALMNDGRVVSWGKNRENSTGHNTTPSYVPKYVLESAALQLDSIVYIATGDGHAMAMDSDGDLYSWGWNGNGQLGLGDNVNRIYATKISNLPFGIGFPCPVAYLGPDVVLCNPVTATLFAGSSSPSYKYEWFKDGTLISIDTANYAIQAYFTINSPGTYKVRITDTSSFRVCTVCSAVEDEIAITTNTVAPINAYFCAPAAKAVTLRVDSPLTTFNWYNDPTSTAPAALVASNTNTFVTPAISASTTYYVEDLRTYTYNNASSYTSAGGAGLTAQSVWSSGTPINMTFTVEKTLTIKTVTVNFLGVPASTTTITIAGPGGPYNHNVTIASTGNTVVTLNRTLGPGTYTMSYTAGYNNARVYSGATYTKGVTGLIAFNNPVTSGYTSTSAFFDWVLEAPSSCARIPVQAILTGTCPLPVIMHSFAGKKTGEDVELFWSTSQERNSKYFEIERSMDGINFSSVGSVDAAGNTNELVDYHFTDIKVNSSGTLYYRLKQVDLDGTFAYSQVISINFSQDELVSMKLIPNPVATGEEVKLIALSSMEGEILLSVVDLTGKVVHEGSYELVQGFNSLSLRTDAMAKGMYLLKVSTEGQPTQTLKLMVN